LFTGYRLAGSWPRQTVNWRDGTGVAVAVGSGVGEGTGGVLWPQAAIIDRIKTRLNTVPIDR
jgi:hypothetical protein